MDDSSIACFDPRSDASPLGDDEVHVWLSTVADATPRALAAAARAVLERLLCDYANCSNVPPRIERGPHGKPFAPELPQLEFNLSHAGRHVLLAFAHGQALGIDLEAEQRRLALGEIAQRFFAPAEARALARLPLPLQRSAFLQLWTRKEAVLKALGVGISFGLDRVEFVLDETGTAGALRAIAPEAGSVAEWTLHRLDPAPGMLGALAWRGPARRVRTFALRA
ncbi:4'-phosphopantetheinyl transferase family protein [Dokdonella soli]|uniref:4'-phosphopantetheinyl transferase domain-containing protein n=1 Tax=Dokdonella soli TaxID=529810 RepID=A0ABN1IFU3_9GAMM